MLVMVSQWGEDLVKSAGINVKNSCLLMSNF